MLSAASQATSAGPIIEDLKCSAGDVLDTHRKTIMIAKNYRGLPASEQQQFIEWLKMLLDEPMDRIWPKGKKMIDIAIRRSIMIKALECLDENDFANQRSSGGYLVPEYQEGVSKFSNI